jgi:hypothetical protein
VQSIRLCSSGYVVPDMAGYNSVADRGGRWHSALSICKAAASHIETRGRTRVQCNGTHARKPGTVYRQEIDNAMHPGLQSTIVFRPDL